jgi:hypothetical protein
VLPATVVDGEMVVDEAEGGGLLECRAFPDEPHAATATTQATANSAQIPRRLMAQRLLSAASAEPG